MVAAVTIPAAAFTWGGWAVTTVEDVPEYAVAGKPFDLTYTVRGHGTAPVDGLTGSVNVWQGKESRETPVERLGEGMYRARVTVPKTGTWNVQITGFGVTNLLPLKVIAANAPTPAPMSAFDRGHQLFVAKGCVTCHSHQLTRAFNRLTVGPDLSEPKFSNAYLARFLANPSIKTDWKSEQRMPNLGLKPAEIAALSAFLNQQK
jgi:mono/diheme cytochrome c family protein